MKDLKGRRGTEQIDRHKVVRLFMDGVSVKYIAERLGVTDSRIYKILRENGFRKA